MRVGSEAGEVCRRREQPDDGYMELFGTHRILKAILNNTNNRRGHLYLYPFFI